MTQAVFAVAQVGPLVTIQDGGRPGLMRYGVPASGAMDRGALAAAQQALGRAASEPAIEVSIGGLTLDCLEGGVTFAVAGGGFQVSVDGSALGSWSIATLRAGSRLVIKPGPWGSWCYLAFAGRLQAAHWTGSAATHAPAGLGGGALAVGQRLVVTEAVLQEEGVGAIPFPAFARPRHRLRVVLGPQDRFFPPEALETLLSASFSLTDAYDRMGVRLSGPPLRPLGRLDMPSEALVRGSIQVSGDGVATVLLADHQTTGGYPRIATILSADLDGFVQLRSRQRLAFTAVTPEEAVAAARIRRQVQDRYLAQMKHRVRSGDNYQPPLPTTDGEEPALGSN